MAVALTRRRFTLDDYHRMLEAGILGEDDRVELIRGEIVEMTPIGRRHVACVNKLTRLFTSRLGHRAIVQVQNPVTLVPDSEPQPDLALLRAVDDFYAETPFHTEDVLLIVEVADTSVATDRAIKMRLYAERGIREAWLIDLPAGHLEVFRGPASGGYRERLTLARGQSVTPEAFPDLSIRIDDLLV